MSSAVRLLKMLIRDYNQQCLSLLSIIVFRCRWVSSSAKTNCARKWNNQTQNKANVNSDDFSLDDDGRFQIWTSHRPCTFARRWCWCVQLVAGKRLHATVAFPFLFDHHARGCARNSRTSPAERRAMPRQHGLVFFFISFFIIGPIWRYITHFQVATLGNLTLPYIVWRL